MVDPLGDRVRADAAALGLRVARVRTAHVYLVQGALDAAAAERIKSKLLADPVTESAVSGARPVEPGCAVVEVHPLPGVMDPVAQSVELAVRDLVGAESRVSTGWRYDLEGVSSEGAERLAKRLLANPVIQRVHTSPWAPASFPTAADHHHAVAHVTIRGLNDEQLTKLSRDAHLFLSPEEMRAIQSEYARLGREPTDVELETLAQTWSEHCVHKTLKSTVRYTGAGVRGPGWTGRPGVTVHADGSVTIKNLLKSTVAAATHELIAGGVDWALSVFTDNSGVVALDDRHGVCIKVETHNRPSAIEPYGGAATGVGGCIRDVIGTGLGARPIANTDVFCVATPEGWEEHGAGGGKKELPPGTLSPKRILSQVVAGVRDYGNRMGIPTVHGAVAFDDRYVGNPLVFCGCVGLIPRELVKGRARAGDRIMAVGGRTGRDGVHGATFSSAQLEHTAADEFAHAVQIGNAVTEKQLLDAIMRARDEFGAPLYHGMTDCGAGGFSSAVGEMGSGLGAEVHLERAPLKYPGLSYTEIWISEAQERMVLAVPPGNVDRLRRICAEESVDCADLGEFGTPSGELILRYHGAEVGRLSMAFLHDGIPMPTREAAWTAARSGSAAARTQAAEAAHAATLLGLLSHPSIASKHWIVRQYDHEVRGATVVKPLVGPMGRGPSDAAVLEPVPGSGRGIALTCGLQTGLGDPALGGDPYEMALGAIDECVRNAVCAGADPARIAILDNFCWASCAKPANMGGLVRACLGCYDGAKAYGTPFVSGKDSLNNQLQLPDGRVIEIPPTLLITGLGMVPDLGRVVTMDAKQAGDVLVMVGATGAALGGSFYQGLVGGAELAMPTVDLSAGPRTARAVAEAIRRGLVRAAHDCSDGGLAVAAAEMLIAGSEPGVRTIGLEVNLGVLPWLSGVAGEVAMGLFAETPSRYLLAVREADVGQLTAVLGGVPSAVIGRFTSNGRLSVPLAGLDVGVEEMTRAWMGPLDY